MIKKVLTVIIRIFSAILILLSVVALVTVLFTKRGEAPKVFGYSAMRILTESMVPTYPVDTMVFVKETEPKEIQVGDVISFYSSDPEILGQVNTHRVQGISSDDEGLCFITKGDNNPMQDKYPAKAKYLVGKVVGSSKAWGKLSRLIANPIVFVCFVVVPLVIILIMNIVMTIQAAKEIEQEEIMKALEEKQKNDKEIDVTET